MLTTVGVWLAAAFLAVCQAQQPEYCNLLPDSGPCQGASFPRFYYDVTSQACKQFSYSGCQGNGNNFHTLSQCKAACVCTQEVSLGETCAMGKQRYYYDPSITACRQFTYNGCGGNGNRFRNAKRCLDACATSFCFLPPETGNCKANFDRYFYNKSSQACELFTYGGCRGNNNRFISEYDCVQKCTLPISAEQRISASNSRRTDTPYKLNVFRAGYKSTVCLLPQAVGICKAGYPRFFYNDTSKMCEFFVFSGCQGNENNFATKTDCQQRCINPSSQSLMFAPSDKNMPLTSDTNMVTAEDCHLPPDQGLCSWYSPLFYYDSGSGNCNQFMYGGCQGNKNRFPSKQECLDACKKYDLVNTWNQPTVKFQEGKNPSSTGYSHIFSGAISKMNSGSCIILELINKLRALLNLELLDIRSFCGNYQTDVCLQPPASGTCQGHNTMYYYNSYSGKCQLFTYGGCGGNENKFASRIDCERKCQGTKPRSQNACLLPPEVGYCRAYVPSYFHNSTSGMCEMFVYGGCDGNENRFDTEKECQERCSSSSESPLREDFCRYPPEAGPCNGRIPKFFYNASKNTCDVFTYGGCLGNDNRFENEQECQVQCKNITSSSDSKSICFQPPETGTCLTSMPMYFYNATSNRCQEFLYGGCGRSDNKFETKEACQERCSNSSETDKPENFCLLPPETGSCRAFMIAYFYNATSAACEEFVYGGCDGNDNNFQTKETCQERCSNSSETVKSKNLCLLPPETGSCRAFMIAYYYNATSAACEEFVYGGCDGNDNNFQTKETCQEKCSNNSEILHSGNKCFLEPEVGPCGAQTPRFFYNTTSGLCQVFLYGGCLGNDNNFATEADCHSECGSTTPWPTQNICLLKPDVGGCSGFYPKYFYNGTTGKCERFNYGGCEGNENNFNTKTQCEDRCKDATQNVCLLSPQTGPCSAFVTSFFHNTTSGMCEKFVYGGCEGNSNRFQSLKECEDRCPNAVPPTWRDLPEICTLPADPGLCSGYYSKFYFNIASGKCEEFDYGGCEGNDNNFNTEIECQEKCKESSPTEPQNVCLLPPDAGPCDSIVPSFFHNATSGMCEQFTYGGCGGNNNRFDNMADCERKCKI